MSFPSSKKLGRRGSCGLNASIVSADSACDDCFAAASPLKVRARLIFLGGCDGPDILPGPNTARDEDSGD